MSHGFNPETLTVSSNRIYYMTFPVNASVTVDSLSIEVTTAAASGTARLGIYTIGTDGRPDALVVDAGTVSVTTQGIKTISGLATSLTAGMYFFAIAFTTGPTVRATDSASYSGLFSYNSVSLLLNSNPTSVVYKTGTTFANPAGTMTGTFVNGPVVIMGV
jgi:hypothetical protein